MFGMYYMDKLLSVVIPSFNRTTLTNRAIESVITSFPELIEIIVVDDCSADSYSFCTFNKAKVPVHVIRLAKNVGPGMARQAGVAKTSSRFIAFLDSDDCYDNHWMDYIIDILQGIPENSEESVFISGITQGERPNGAMVRRKLADISPSLQLYAARIIALLFNPFYTQSIVISRNLAFFIDGIRYCEDYYSTVLALFNANTIMLPHVVACHLGRAPNSSGGESFAKEKMFKGEMQVRFALLKNPCIPMQYRLLVPSGIVFQYLRTGVKQILRLS